MRVLVVAAWPPWPITDGARLILHHQLDELASRHEITLVAGSRHPGERAAPVPGGIALEWYGPPRYGPVGYLGRRWASLRSGEPADVFRHHVPRLLAAYQHQLRVRPPEVVHLMGPGTARLAATAATAGVPVVHMPIDAWRMSYGLHEPRLWWRRVMEVGERRKVRRHEQRHLPRCSAVVVVAERDAAVLRDAVPGLRVEVVPNGIDAGPQPTAPADLPILGFHGALSTWPNRAAAATLAEQVLPLVRAQVPGAGALIIGRDPGPEVRRLAGPTVEVTGAVTDVRDALARVAVYVAPMALGSGLKNKVLEAMAAGLPVVATRDALDGIGAGPGVVLADSVPELAAAVTRLLSDAAERRRLGTEARQRVVRDFTWERSASAIEAIWASVGQPPAHWRAQTRR